MQYLHTFLSQSMSFCHSWSGFTYCIVSNMSVRYDTILLPRCHFELLDVWNSFSLWYMKESTRWAGAYLYSLPIKSLMARRKTEKDAWGARWCERMSAALYFLYSISRHPAFITSLHPPIFIVLKQIVYCKTTKVNLFFNLGFLYLLLYCWLLHI